jgi:hypothetical protein
MLTEDFNDILPAVKNKLLLQLNEESSNSICEFITKCELSQFLLLIIKNKNCVLLQFLWYVFKEFNCIRKIVNNSMIHMLLTSLDDTIIFFEIFKWYNEFGCDANLLSINIITLIYLKGINYPKIKPLIMDIIVRLNNFENVRDRTVFFIYDELSIIKPFITNNIDNIKRMMIRSYWYDSVDTLCEVQRQVKLSFFSIGWYLLSVPAFNHIVLKNNINIYEDVSFSCNFANYICISNRWEYIPYIIRKLTDRMWKRIQLYFYCGSLTIEFVTVLFHQIKKQNIDINKLISSSLQFNSHSKFVQFLKDNNYYNIFISNKNKTKTKELFEAVESLKDEILDASIIAVSPMMVIYTEKNFDALYEISFDCSLNLSNRYKSEIKYIDSLLENDDLGWDKNMIDRYSEYKKYMNYIFDQLNIGNELVTKFNSYLPLEHLEFNPPYRLRIINNIISIYNKLKIKKFQEEYNKVYENCIAIKIDIVNNMNILTEYHIQNKLKKDPIIVDFLDLIENSSNYSFTKSNKNNDVINLLKHNPQIQSKVKFMLDHLQLPIEEILPILQKYLLINENFTLS